MDKFKSFVMNHFEESLVLAIALVIIVVNFLVVQKLAFLNFYYLPVLVAGYVMGRKMAILASFFCITLIVFSAMNNPHIFVTEKSSLLLATDLMVWSGFLILAAYVVGTLYEQREKKISELKNAYIGVLEILAKYLESYDRYTRSHSLRVADYATGTAIAMDLPRSEVENIKVAALLHDIGKIDISSDLIKKAASLSGDEKEIVASHPRRGVELLSAVGGVLKDAMPVVEAHHQFFVERKSKEDGKAKKVPLGARILAVADSFDAMVTDRPYRKGLPHWEAMEELERCSGTQFDPEVVEAFKRVYAKDYAEKLEAV
jgi:putative nucleotidyltransferase with HDIG domain